MNRRLFLLFSLVAMVACGGNEALPTAVPTASFPEGNNSQGDVAVPDTAVVPTGELAPLPPLTGVSGDAGLSGGSAPVVEGDTAVGMVVADPFAQTAFTLNASLPAEPAEAAVLRQVQTGDLSLDAARHLAARFGIKGELYRENIVADIPDANLVLPTIYYAFDGPHTVNISPWAANYQDNSVDYDPANPPDFATASQAAEQFLQTYGLLDFPYVIRPGYASDVLIIRQVDGRALNQPEIVVGISPAGQVSYVSYQVLSSPEVVSNYPLISAADAWAQLQSGVAANNIPYAIYPAEGTAVSTNNPLPDAQSWQRQYAPGETVQLYGWPNAYLPASGSGAARVQLYPFQLAGNEEVLNQIAEAAGQQITIEGVMGEDGRTVTVNDWSPITLEPLTLQGIVQRESDQVQLEATDGQTYQLPDVPPEIEGGTEVFVYAWNSQQAGDETPVLQWERIDEANIAEVELPVVEVEVPTYASVAINSAELAYYVTYLFAEESGEGSMPAAPTILLQPVWRFTGTVDSGEEVEFYVQAVQADLIRP